MDLDRETLLKLYTTMSLIRNFEERGIPETGQRPHVGIGALLGRPGGGSHRRVRPPDQ